MKRIYLLSLMVIFLIILSCAASVSIGEIKNTPERYHDKKVTVAGTVDETLTLPILGVGVYLLNDGTGKIWVKPKESVPEKGERVYVKGVIKVGLAISGRSFGLILIEQEEDLNK
jgi:hypothetical protein